MQMMKRFADTRSNGERVRIGHEAKLVFAAILVVSIFFVQGVLAGGFALSGIGSKAIGMGGAFRGLADDWSAAYWNPAGLTQLKQSEINGMLVAITPRPEYTPNIRIQDLNFGYRNDRTLYPNDKTNFLPDVSGFIKFANIKGLTAGLAIYVPYGLGSEWDLFNPVGMDLANPYPWYDHKADLQIIDFHPTVAKAFMDDKLSIGAGVSIQRGQVTFQKAYLKPSGLPIPHEFLVINSEIKGTGWGYGANFGILYKLSEKLQFGLSGRTGSTLKLSGNAKQELFTFNNNELRDYLLANSYTRVDSNQILFLFAPSNHLASPKAKTDFKTPADFGFGLAWKPTEKLSITGDLAYTQWSSLDKIQINLTGTDPTGAPAQNSVIMLDWKNTLRFSLGAEYWVAKPLALRLGFYRDPSPVPDKTFTPLIPDVGDKNSINIGAAFTFSGLELAYNFEYIAFKDRTIAASALNDINGDGIYDNYPGAYKQKLYASHASVTYRF
jgi:long-chain fatty acid transport protein